ncbi:MAG: hypothetical protein KME30_20895 [Iphinoe sp. HA4291-MV1]|nr:hypothetical protein [Iphinoe sp. HA4291-MV1]
MKNPNGGSSWGRRRHILLLTETLLQQVGFADDSLHARRRNPNARSHRRETRLKIFMRPNVRSL